MPITMRCPSCDATMNAPDHAVGRKVRCPKCGDAVPVEETAEEESPRRGMTSVASRKPARRSRDEEPEEEELEEVEDEEDDDNVKRRPAVKKSQPANNEDIANDLPSDYADEVLRELRRKERLMWVGQPLPKLLALRSLSVAIFGVVFFVVGIVFTAVMASGMGGAGALCLIFSLVGVGMMFAPLFAYKRGQRTFYALTNRRALVWQGGYFAGLPFRAEVSPAKRQARQHRASETGEENRCLLA